MIRSTASPAAKWKPVPEGFRVDWGAVDLNAFRKKPWFITAPVAAYNAVTLALSTLRITISVLLWRMTDALRGSSRRGRSARDAVGRVIRVSQPKPHWNLSVQIHVGRGRATASEPEALAA